MRRSELLEGIREMKFVSIHQRHESGELSEAYAAELLGMNERTFRRWWERYREQGAAGLRDRRLGTAARNRVPEADADVVERLYRTTYVGFTAKHFHEHLVSGHGFRWGYTWTKSLMQRPLWCRWRTGGRHTAGSLIKGAFPRSTRRHPAQG